MLRRQDKEGHSKDSIRTGGEYPYLLSIDVFMLQPEGNLCTRALANPVVLHYLYALGPVYFAEVEKLIGIFGDTEKPLRPFIILRKTRDHLTAPVIYSPYTS